MPSRTLRPRRMPMPRMKTMVALAERGLHANLLRQGAASYHIRTSAGRQHFYDVPGRGDLPAVVLLHGATQGGLHYGRLMRRLRPHVQRIIIPDAPAHGFSDVPSHVTAEVLERGMTELLDRVLDRPAVVFGTSLGGAMALKYGVARPDNVRSLVVLSPAGAAMDDQTRRALLDDLSMPRLADARRFVHRVWERAPWYTPFMAVEVQRRFTSRHIQQLLDSVCGDHELQPDHLSGLTMPIRLIWGRQERLLPEANLHFFSRHLPEHAEIHRPERFGHAAFLEYPAEVAQHILQMARRPHEVAAGRDVTASAPEARAAEPEVTTRAKTG